MKISTIAFIVTLSLLGSSCVSQRRPYHDPYSTVHPQKPLQQSTATVQPESPCTDSLYLALKGKPIDQMTDREYQYFLQRDKQCMDYQQANAVARTTTQPQNEMVQEVKRANNTYTTYLVVGLILSLVALIPLTSSTP